MENPFEIINQRLDRIEFLLEKINSNIERNTSKSNYPEIMGINQLTEYLNLSKTYIYQLTRTRCIPHSKKGNKLYFDKEVVTKWVLENKISTQEEIEQKTDKYLLKKGLNLKVGL
ncbi:helix-turn-helix domain-containing protein [Polaribacter sp. SA4-12]|uniref:helix-turn-helix domain-containing protein n=1 Tax=Polaribacter sp. SA4-12 TaxID=1312072 RepID=UPI000B3C1F4C|nr:helix-turn-helix domain-containing protein [Polaribacter sp. SA4-12]ARV14828.1 hypothetical protein BTO07_06540 [Polaribacter sp. SA4-12]